MSFVIRSYRHEDDYDRVGEFLIQHYKPGDNLLLWVQPRWEYMHYHPFIKETDRRKIGLAEMDGQIVGVVHYESNEGWIYFQVDPANDQVKVPLFDYAEATFGSFNQKRGQDILAIFINEADQILESLAAERGFAKQPEIKEVMSRYLLDEPIPQVELPPGFHLQSLAEENDLRKINQVLWRGFNHPGPPPEEEIPGRKEVQAAPNFQKEMNFVAVAPNGDYAAYCGIWYVPQNKLAYVEPVATDPTYRRMGLGTAVVLEGLRRSVPLGAEVAWVGSDLRFYLAMGFEPMFQCTAWLKTL